jgi:hypothetical protein
MSKLALYGRQYVVFDPANKDHRRWFANFNKHLSWKDCPVRFVIDNDHGDLVTMIQRQLIQYYVDREFSKAIENPHVAKKPRVVKKPRK